MCWMVSSKFYWKVKCLVLWTHSQVPQLTWQGNLTIAHTSVAATPVSAQKLGMMFARSAFCVLEVGEGIQQEEAVVSEIHCLHIRT